MNKLPADLSDNVIEDLRTKSRNESMRVSSPELEEILYKPIPVLNHGFVRLIDYMGTDSSIVQAARVSYGVGTKKTQEDKGLINYLMRHGHTTPFEMCELKLHLKLPIFVARQWLRHRTANVNEYSARYSVLSNEFYLPEIDQIAQQSESNRQGKSDDALEPGKAQEILDAIACIQQNAYEKYSHLLNDMSLTRELARTVLPVGVYTEMYWKIDLHNLLHFLKLRADSHAQYEIRCYANVILDIVKKWVPHTYEAFVNYRQKSVSVPQHCQDLINRALRGEKISPEESGLSKGEWQEFTKIFSIDKQ
ncbi:MAG: FAD-dependent thymidylate synthase [Holosporaceae bacterium]|jgi:thymidylate synthase (FAD)|nr:FAD-dependent thymidylate synthase [Holosporaceae bacterium]